MREEVKQYEEQKRGLKKEMRENQYRVDDRYIKEVKTGASDVEKGVSEGIKMVKSGGPSVKRKHAGFTLESLLQDEGEMLPPKKRQKVEMIKPQVPKQPKGGDKTDDEKA